MNPWKVPLMRTMLAAIIAVPWLALSGAPASAEGSAVAEVVNGCVSSGRTGLFSSHSNEQVCEFGFFACVQTNPAASQFTSSNLMPPTTVGMIMMPFGADWHLTGGNNGYVENVCNGRAGISNVITMVSNINRSEAWEPFGQQLSLIQGLCGGQCRAEFFVLSAVPLRLNEDNSIVIRDNALSGNPLEELMVKNYIHQGAVERGGVFMGANGYHDDILQVILGEDAKQGWYVMANGYVEHFSSTEDLVGDGFEIAFRVICLFL
jgi:hypothetical protein